MQDFPDFMKVPQNHIDSGVQNTDDIDGYFYEGGNGQMAFWTCRSDQASKAHRHDFDEYMVCVAGRYTAVVDGKETVLLPGDELFIPSGTLQSGSVITGTRTIHAFSGKRIKQAIKMQYPLFLDPDSEEGKRRRQSFDADAEGYDRARPDYPQALNDEIIAKSCLGPQKTALEIGIGTGKATPPFLATGCSLTALEPGEHLAGFATERFAAYPNFTLLNTTFERFKAAAGSFDLLYSATAFHWVPEEIGFLKAFALLKPGGILALFWNRPFAARKDDPLHQEIQQLYQKYRPNEQEKPVEEDTERYEKLLQTFRFYGFEAPELKLYNRTREFTAEGYSALVNTYSDHLILPPEEKESFETELKAAIKRHGNKMTVYDTIELYLAKRPG